MRIQFAKSREVTLGLVSIGDVYSYTETNGVDLWMKCVHIGKAGDGTCTVVNLSTGNVVPDALAGELVILRDVEAVEL